MQPHITPNAPTAQTTEEWRDIPGYEGLYRVSNCGRVLSLRYRGWDYQRVLVPVRQRIGYLTYMLFRGGVGKKRLAHRLVMAAFVGESDREVNHKDGDKANNRLHNLEYVTHSDNLLHASRVLSRRFGGALLEPTEQDREIRRLAAEGVSQRKIAAQFGISQPAVSYIVRDMVRPDR